jgi:bacteriocin biosynthesis cyclodehydratase domain-containing protein
MGDAIQLRVGDDEVHVLRAEPAETVRAVILAIDGARDRAALAEAIGDREVVDAVVDELERAGLLGPALDPGDELALHLAHRTTDPSAAARAIRQGRIAVSAPPASAAVACALLREHGIAAEALERGAPLGGEVVDAVVAVAERPDLARLDAIDEAAVRARVPCLFVDLTVGPFYVPGEGSCHRCFRRRLLENAAAWAELLAAQDLMLETGEPLEGPAVLSAHRHLAISMAVAEIVALLGRHRPLRTLNRAITVALDELRTWSEPVWRVPWCPRCGSAP